MASASHDGGFFKEECSVLIHKKISLLLKALHNKFNTFLIINYIITVLIFEKSIYPMFFASLVPEIFLHYLINALISEERPNVQNREDNWV